MSTIANWIDKHAEFQPQKPALIYEGRSITYGEFAQRAADTARMLKHQMSVGRGDRVAYLGYNSPEFLILMFACARLGALFLPLNWRLAAPEHTYILKDAAAKVLAVEADFREHAEGFRDQLPDCEFIACRFESNREASLWRNMADLIETAQGDTENPHVDETNPLLLVYTSGTTGRPKGALLTQQALFYNALNSLHMHDMCARDLILTVLPMFHVGGLNIQTLPALYSGATVILHQKFDPADTLACIRGQRPTLLVLVPATMAAVQAQADWEESDLGSLRVLTTGSCHVPEPLIAAFRERSVPVIQVYGSTETGPVSTYQRATDAEVVAGSVGKAGLHCEIRIADEQGNELSRGESGEVLIRGGNLFFEYWGNELETGNAFRDGWFRSGDIGYLDDSGDLWINDRKKDMVISGGENIYPAELEVVLEAMPEIQEAAVVGRPDEQWGEVAVAVVVIRAGAALDEATLLGRFEDKLARFKHPKAVVFMDALPRNAMGKVLKYELREQLAKGSQ